ncbi:hypothetical protein ACFPZJ_38460 [Streptomyces bullii]|uniref:Uncharacterized protein n=1 Tax=Streptomyces bullii TaxID=349910 RepID=A0ABW0V2A0_9ACTN
MVARGLDTDERAVRQLRYELEVIGRLAPFDLVAHLAVLRRMARSTAVSRPRAWMRSR